VQKSAKWLKEHSGTVKKRQVLAWPNVLKELRAEFPDNWCVFPLPWTACPKHTSYVAFKCPCASQRPFYQKNDALAHLKVCNGTGVGGVGECAIKKRDDMILDSVKIVERLVLRLQTARSPYSMHEWDYVKGGWESYASIMLSPNRYGHTHTHAHTSGPELRTRGQRGLIGSAG